MLRPKLSSKQTPSIPQLNHSNFIIPQQHLLNQSQSQQSQQNSRKPLILTKISLQDDTCCICLETMAKQFVGITICQHKFHKVCIDKWLINQTSCPLCKLQMS